MKVYGGHICGDKQQSTTFVGTGPLKGNYPIYICTKQPHQSGQHHDQNANKSWS